MIRTIVTALAILACARAAAAQTAPAAPATEPQFLSRFDFNLGLERLSHDDPRFVWNGNFGGALDVLDYVYGRGTFYANYEVVMGEQLKNFDPNQGNYTLGGLATRRFGTVEAGGMFHHVSRHLSDRPKVIAVDWNMIGFLLRRRGPLGRLNVDSQANIRAVVQKSFVDYTWELDAWSRQDLPLAPRVSLISGVSLRVLGVDGSRNRGRQAGFRAEGGLRVNGERAALEFFAAGERKVDPYQLEFGTATWFLTGFRVVSR